MSSFTPLFKTSEEKPASQYRKSLSTYLGQAVIRDNFQLSTWLFIGGVVHYIACLVINRYAMLPAVFVLGFRGIDHLLMAAGITRNRYLDGAILTKFGAQMPKSDGSFGTEPADESMVIFFLGAQVNHPLGSIAPGHKDIQRYFDKVSKALESNPEETGFLGMSSWISAGEEAAGNELLFVVYLRDFDALHRFAHGPDHMSGISWWTKHVKQYPHLAISHETYVVPKGNWENIYINFRPSGMGRTVYAANKLDGKSQAWNSPVVDSTKGPLRTAARRLLRPDLTEHEQKDNTLWDKTFA